MTEREIVEVMARINGLFVGQLDADEMAAFERAWPHGPTKALSGFSVWQK